MSTPSTRESETMDVSRKLKVEGETLKTRKGLLIKLEPDTFLISAGLGIEMA